MENDLLTLVGSQTGTTEKYASILANFAKGRGYKVTCLKFDDWLLIDESTSATRLSNSKRVFFYLTSTFGNGTFPSNVLKFFKWLTQNHPANLLKGQMFALHGFGQKSTGTNFNIAGRKLETRLLELGASLIVESSWGDADLGHEVVFRPWMRLLWTTLQGSYCRQMGPFIIIDVLEKHKSIKLRVLLVFCSSARSPPSVLVRPRLRRFRCGFSHNSNMTES
jgi:sulfite reductase alpha subunit-like flavoprotein